MSILGTILSKVFHHDQPTATPPAAPPVDITMSTGAGAPVAPATPAPMSEVDVEAELKAMAATYSHPVNWRESIVDLMAMLGIDNSLAQRRALAFELGYTGDTSDTATMNIWLHKQVMQKLAANGGKVPADLLK
jgi:hypothetical protein